MATSACSFHSTSYLNYQSWLRRSWNNGKLEGRKFTSLNFVGWKHRLLPRVVASVANCRSVTDVERLESEFGSPGLTFSGIGDGCVVKMTLDNGNAASLMLPSGLITSFKAQMWHGGTMELLHTTVSAADDGGAVIQGGLSLAISCENDAGFSWSPNAWGLHRVTGTPQESIRVELIGRNEQGDVEVKHLITLEHDQLDSEILVSNSSTSSLRLMGSVNSHLSVSTPDATYAVGLQGSDFIVRSPIIGSFSLLPPDLGKRSRQHAASFLPLNLFKWITMSQNADDDIESLATNAQENREREEQDNYKHLATQLSRIYSSAPQNITIIDRGRRNSVTVKRRGFNELYMFSPGAEHEWYSKYSYICIGHTAMLQPILLNVKSQWRGGLQLQNPNS